MEEKGLTLKDIIKVLLGNKWLYLIMAAIFMIGSVVGLSIYSGSESRYVAFYDYDVAGFSTTVDESGNIDARYIDGERFEPRSVITKEKIKTIFDNNKKLKDLDAELLYKNGLIKSFEYSIKYTKNDHQKDEKDAAYIESKRGYELILNHKLIDESQAKALAEEIANEVIKSSDIKVDKIQYDSYLKYYDNAKDYPEKITSLNDGIEYLKNLSDSLISSYGDVLLDAGQYGGDDDKYYLESKTISSWQNQFKIVFDSYYVSSLLSELEVNGFISSDSAMYVAKLKTNITNLEREIAVNEDVLTDLKNQRDALVAAIGTNATIESVEIAEYNTEIIALTKKIAEQKETLDIYKLQLEKLDTSSLTQEEINAYMSKLSDFNDKLTSIRNDLEFYTNQYEAIAKSTMKNNSHVYFENPDIISTQGNVSIVVIIGASLGIGLFAPMLINLCVAAFNAADGKAITFRKKEE